MGSRQTGRQGRRAGGATGIGVALLAMGLVTMGLLAVQPAAAKAPQSVADLVVAVEDAVVNISASEVVQDKVAEDMPDLPQGTPLDDMFKEFFKHHNNPGESEHARKTNALGSGFVIDPSGIIITNNHVIADATEITIIFTDGSKLPAKVLGKDAKVDVAVLKVASPKPLKAVKFGDSDRMRVGDVVMAVGNPFGLGGSVTEGIISAKNRNIDNGPYDDFIQTDAAINKGNSGGPLFDLDGDVIGINTAILSPSGGSVGIGFATPAATVVPIIQQLRDSGSVHRGWLGVRIQSVDDAVADSLGLGQARGALVAGVEDGGPSKTAGLMTGDLITRFEGRMVRESHDLPRYVASTPVGKDVTVTILRGGKELTKTVRLGELPGGDKQASISPTPERIVPPPEATPAVKLYGMELSDLNAEIRRKLAIKDAIKGVAVTGVQKDSPAGDHHLQPGDVIIEVENEAVATPADITARINGLKTSGKKVAVLVVSNAQGDTRSVALPIQ